MATVQERYDTACAKLEAAANAIRHGDKSANYDLERLAKERDRLGALLAAQRPQARSARTLLSMEDE